MPDLGETLQGRWLFFCDKNWGPKFGRQLEHVYLCLHTRAKMQVAFFPDPVVMFFRIFTRRNPQLNSLRGTILHSYG